MDNRSWGSTMAVAVVLVLSLSSICLAGQSATAEAKSSNIPRTADGTPDMQGYWTKGPGIGGYSIEATFQANNALLGTITAANPFREAPPPPGPGGGGKSAIVDPPDGRIPYQPWAAAKRKEIAEKHATDPRGDTLDPQVRCALDGVPRINYQAENPFQILQLPGYVVMLYEWTHAYRVIPTDGRPRLQEDVKLWMGESRGRWEDNTLVVDVTNNNDMNFFDSVGTFHSDALHVIERWTLVDADTINYEVTLDDPKVFTRPWKMVQRINRIKDKAFELVEHACYEGERDFDHILTGSPSDKVDVK